MHTLPFNVTIQCSCSNSAFFSSHVHFFAVIDGCDGNRESSCCYGVDECISPLGERKPEPKVLHILAPKSTNGNGDRWDYEICSDQSRTSSACGPGKSEPAMLFSLPPLITSSVIIQAAALAGNGAGTGTPAADHHYLHGL